jgi:hypothetical protein
MALKFRRRQKLFPGVYLNFSKSGISTTIGMKGLSVNLGKSGAYLNTGIPGTGIYDRKKLGKGQSEKAEKSTEESPYYFIPPSIKGEIKSKTANEVTSESLEGIKETFLAAAKEKIELEKEIPQIQRTVKHAREMKIFTKILLFGFITKHFDKQYLEKATYLSDLKEQLANCNVSIEIDMDAVSRNHYSDLKEAFIDLSTCHKIWDQTSAVKNDDNRSSAGRAVSRRVTKIFEAKISFLNAEHSAFCFENKNGSNIYLYPGFTVMYDNKNSFGLIALSDLDISYETVGFLETEVVPNDTIITGETWAKVNKNGTPDKRFSGNYKIPIVEYAELKFTTKTGVNEVYVFSDVTKTETFYKTFNQYKNQN